MIVSSSLIDIWDAKTFDCELGAILSEHADLLWNYTTTENHIFLTHDRDRSPQRSIIRPENQYASDFRALLKVIEELMLSRTIRAWHYTRLTASEVNTLRNQGIHLSTRAKLRSRMDSLVASGTLGPQLADALYAKSPFHSDQLEGRSGKFWMVSHPVNIEDPGVAPLLAHWGGEVAHFWTNEPSLLAPLAAIGKPCVIELAIPLALTEQCSLAGEAATATFSRALGCIPSKHAFDLYVTKPLDSDTVLRIHSEGDSSFRAMGISYPDGYVDIDIGRWKELTGEDD